jgi:hypothetical protein
VKKFAKIYTFFFGTVRSELLLRFVFPEKWAVAICHTDIRFYGGTQQFVISLGTSIIIWKNFKSSEHNNAREMMLVGFYKEQL